MTIELIIHIFYYFNGNNKNINKFTAKKNFFTMLFPLHNTYKTVQIYIFAKSFSLYSHINVSFFASGSFEVGKSSNFHLH